MNERSHVFEKISGAFPFLRGADTEIRNQILAHAVIARIPKGKIIFLEGDECSQLALILSGVVRVYKPAESGREITLYRLLRGESCVLTASCIFSKGRFTAVAVTEEDVEAAMVPAGIFRDWIRRHDIWRGYIFDLLSKRLAEIIATIEEVAFRRMDIRIAEHILRLAVANDKEIRTTHHDIAMELGTSREVVSRILKQFEYEKLISLGRGTISILDMKDLEKKAAQAGF